jgi:hypothetical protein
VGDVPDEHERPPRGQRQGAPHALRLERRVIASGDRDDLAELRRRIYRDGVRGYRDGGRFGVIDPARHPPLLIYDDRAGLALVADVAWLDDRAGADPASA